MRNRIVDIILTGSLAIITVFLLVSISMFAFAEPAKAAPLNEIQARSIYAVAYGQYHGPREWLDKQPNIYIVDQARLCDVAKQRPDCSVLGLSVDGVVYIRDDLDFETTFAASILLHEFIHHFQWLEGKQDAIQAAMDRGDEQTVCELWVENERQAYLIQIDVLEKVGDYGSVAKARSVMTKLHCD